MYQNIHYLQTVGGKMSPKQFSTTTLDPNYIVQLCSIFMKFGTVMPVAYTNSNVFIFNPWKMLIK